MKNLTILSGIAILAGLVAITPKASAQITLGQSDLPSVGLTVVIDSDGTTKPSPGITNISSPQTWDFSHLLKQKSKTYSFVASGATKYASVFPSANLADSSYGGNGYNFFNISATDFSVVGAEEIQSVSGHSLQIEINLNPAFEQSALPANLAMNNVTDGVAKGSDVINVSILFFTKVMFTANINYADTVDAYGTMTMPNNKTYPVLRQKHHELDIDSVYGYSGGTWVYIERVITNKNQYDWYAKGVGYILAEMDMSPTFDTTTNVLWDTTAPTPLGINEISINNKVNVYPNPANTQVTFNMFNTAGNEEGYISIYDITGRELERVAVKAGVSIVNTASYTNGVYMYNLTDSSGALLAWGKFIVQH